MLSEPPVTWESGNLIAAAKSLSGEELTGLEHAQARDLLDWIGDWSDTPNLPDCLSLSRQLTSLFTWQPPAAPRAVFVGGTLRGPTNEPIPVTGISDEPAAALAACLGEAAETLSQFEREGDIATRMSLRDAARQGIFTTRELAAMTRRLPASEHDGKIDWVSAERINDGRRVVLPASLCLRRPTIPSPPHPLSIGSAAGRSLEAATRHALLELIERDALAAWKTYGNPARRLDAPTWTDARHWLSKQRCPSEPGQIALRDIAAPHMPPVVAASRRAGADETIAFGSGAGATATEAAIAALREMIAHDAGLTISRLRLEAGIGAAGDRKLLASARGKLPSEPSEPAVARLPTRVSTLAEHFALRGTPIYRLDLTRPDLDIAAVKLVCFGLTMETADRD